MVRTKVRRNRNVPHEQAETDTSCALYVGLKFSSFAEVVEAIKRFEEKTCTKFYIRDSRRIESARLKLTNIKPSLVYSEVRYACFRGGRRIKKQGKGIREDTGTFQNECPSYISLRVTKDGSHLEVKSCSYEHNHELSKASRQILTKKFSEFQPTVKIAPKQVFDVSHTVKIAPKQVFEVQPTVKIAPKPVFDAQAPAIVPSPVVSDVVSLATPNPVITDLSSIADTVISSNLIEAALSAYKQSTMSLQQPDGTPVSIYVVHPQPNGSNIVTIPTIGNVPSANVGTVPAPSGASLPSSSSQCVKKAKKPSSKVDLQTTQDNIEKIGRYEDRIKKYKKDIKVLQSQHRRQLSKIEKLQSIIKDLRNPGFMEHDEEEEEDVSEDMSEDEIYTELLKHQSESGKEDSDF